MSEIALFLNGLAPKKIPDLSQYKKIYCTDGAYNYLRLWSIKPDVVCGDFDSLNREEIPNDIEVVELLDQNFTDFEKTLELLKQRNYTIIHIYGSSGMEHDHFLGNLSSALKYKDEMNLTFFDDYSSYFFADNSTILNDMNNRTISLYPFPLATSITTKGLKYLLKGEDLEISQRVGTRNTIIENEASIEFKEGNLLIFIKNTAT